MKKGSLPVKTAVLSVLSCAVACAASTATTVYETSSERPFRELRHVPSFSPHEMPTVPTLDIDAAKPSHPFLGLGVSFAEASCRALMELSAAEREKALRMVFTDEGAGVSMGRIHVGCSDYSDHVYTYDDVMDDDKLEHFSIDPDRKYVLPVVKEAQKLNPSMFFFGSVWTPPAWMKLGRSLGGGWIDSRKLPVFCDYYVKFLQAYAQEGVKVSAISAQNEPCSDQQGESPECKWGPNEERLFAAELMPPRLKAAGLDTEIWLHDCEPHEWRQVLSLLDEPAVRANAQGVAWHSYGDWPEKGLGKILAKYPGVRMYHTEQGPHLDRARRPITWWGEKVTRFLNAGCSSFTSWCLALDEEGRPNTSRGFNCAGFLEIDSETGKVRPSAQWELFRHIGPYVKRGAQVLATDYAAQEVERNAIPMSERFVMAFRNPDGSVVVVATNKNGGMERKLALQVKCRGQYAVFQIPHLSVVTIVLK